MKFTARSSRSTASRCRFLTARRSQHGHVSAPETLVDFHRSILTYHVLSGKVLSSDLSLGLEAETLEGSNIMVTSLTPPTINGDSVIGPADVLATNGVIHVIDTVLMPGSDDEPTMGPTAMEESDSAGRASLAVAAAAAVAYVL